MQQKAGPFAAGGAPRKLTIKPLRTAPKLPANFEQATWAKLLDAVRAVHGKQSFRAQLSARPEVLAKLRDGVLASIERERGGDQVERSLLAELRMLYDLGLYQRHFEEQFLVRILRLYLAEALQR